MQQRIVNRGVLLLVLVVISALFFQVVKPFLQSVFIASLFAALFHPLYRQLKLWFGNRESLASIATLLIVLFFVVTPLSIVFTIVVSQAADLADRLVPLVQREVLAPGAFSQLLSKLPFYDSLQPYRSMLLNFAGDMSSSLSGWAVEMAQIFTKGTIGSAVSLLIILYTMFFLLIDGDRFLYYLLYYIPLNDEDESKLLARFLSVTRATLKGTAVIGFLQGGLAGAALAIAGIPSALFWAVTMMFLSVVPGIGGAIVWVPATLYLLFSGKVLTAIIVGAFCAIVVGAIDNLLRPKLVGSDTQLHELMIFFSTLGGLLLFGFMGFIIGPIIAALFVTVWELYAYEFSRWLPTTAYRPQSGDIVLPHERFARSTDRGRRKEDTQERKQESRNENENQQRSQQDSDSGKQD